MAKQWYLRQGADILGPLSSSQLEHAAAIGYVSPDTQVSLDREHWHRATKIKGLAFKTSELAIEGERPVPPPPASVPPPPAPPPPPPPPAGSPSHPNSPRTSSAEIVPPVLTTAQTGMAPGAQQASIRSSGKRTAGIIVGALVVLIAAVTLIPAGPGRSPIIKAAINPNRDLEHKLQLCSSREGIRVQVYYANTFSRDDVVLDFQQVTGSSIRRIDPVHLLLQFGHQMESSAMRRLILAREGRQLFLVDATVYGGRIT
jgi:hypothetical protein